MQNKKHTTKGLMIAAVLLMVTAAALGAGLLPASADHLPANKSAVAASTMEKMTTQMEEGANSTTVTLLETQFRTGNNADFVYQLTLECALFTEVEVIGNDESRSKASVKAWVEIDGETLGVAPDEDPEAEDFGEVVFCNRDYLLEIQAHEDEEAMFRQYIDTRNANAFTWIHEDLESGVHDIVVKAELEVNVEGIGNAHALVGKRTLHVEPIKLPQH